MQIDNNVLVVIPAYNEADAIAGVVNEVFDSATKAAVLVVDDASADATSAEATAAGAEVVRNVFNLGVGGAMRVGFRFAAEADYRAVVQVDGDGQHDPRDIERLLEALTDDDTPMTVIGARFAGRGDYRAPAPRRLAMRILARYLSHVTHVELTDVTSGFRAHNRASVELFARTYPADYLADTVESLVITMEAGGRVAQVPVRMRDRVGGTPSQSSSRAALYLVRVMLMLAVAVLRHRAPRPTIEDALP